MTAVYYIKKNNLLDLLILIIFILSFIGGTYNHVIDIVIGGFFPYTKWWGVPKILNIYWTTLTIFDPFAIVALIINVRFGFIIALTIMLTDVPINLYTHCNYSSIPIYKNYGLLLQTIFMSFLLISVRRVWKHSNMNTTLKS